MQIWGYFVEQFLISIFSFSIQHPGVGQRAPCHTTCLYKRKTSINHACCGRDSFPGGGVNSDSTHFVTAYFTTTMILQRSFIAFLIVCIALISNKNIKYLTDGFKVCVFFGALFPVGGLYRLKGSLDDH